MPNYWTVPNGNNGNPGTKAAPFSLAAANAIVEPGDTIYMGGGEYIGEKIQPKRNGTAAQRITYIAENVNDRPILRQVKQGLVLDSTHKSGFIGSKYFTIDSINMDGDNVRHQDGGWQNTTGPGAHIKQWAYFKNAQYNIIRNCVWTKVWGWSGIKLEGNSIFNQILDNDFSYCGVMLDPDVDSGDTISLKINANKNFIARNSFSHAGHNCLSVESKRNIIRDNIFDGDWSDHPGSGGAGFGQRVVSLKGIHSNYQGEQNVFEGNILKNTGTTWENGTATEAPCMKCSGTAHIVRHNYFFSNSSDGKAITTGHGDAVNSGYVEDCRIYQNSFSDIGGPAWSVSWSNSRDPSDHYNRNHVFKNNLVSKTAQIGDYDLEFLRNNAALDANLCEYNLVYDKNGNANVATKQANTNSLEWYQQNYSSNFQNNVFGNDAAPLLTDATPTTKAGFIPQEGSPAINGGYFLTETYGTGTSGRFITLAVGGTYYFTHGLSQINVDGDTIKVGTNDPVKIVHVIHPTESGQRGQIEVDTSIDWADGDKVSLDYGGSKPDIGAYQSDTTTVNDVVINPTGDKVTIATAQLYNELPSITPDLIIEGTTTNANAFLYSEPPKVTGVILYECCDGTFELDPDDCPEPGSAKCPDTGPEYTPPERGQGSKVPKGTYGRGRTRQRMRRLRGMR